jgi:hypothetical protein
MGSLTQDRQHDESLGIRVHDINKQRALERALELMRAGLKADWYYLTDDDLDGLRWLFGEVWSTTNRDEWDGFRFSGLDLRGVRNLLNHADRLRRHGVLSMLSIDSTVALLASASAGVDGREPGLIADEDLSFAN